MSRSPVQDMWREVARRPPATFFAPLLVLSCGLTAASPSPASAQSCPDGRVDRIEFDRSKPFLSETEAGGGLVHSVQRLMNRFHVRTLETTLRWELLVREGACFDSLEVSESTRTLRELPYLASARVESRREGGDHVLRVTTVDRWALLAGFKVNVDEGFELAGLTARARNVFGTGTSVAFLRRAFRERTRVGWLLRQPNLLGTRLDVTLLSGRTRSGTYFEQSLLRPYPGELGRFALRQAIHNRTDEFAYALGEGPDRGPSLLRYDFERYEIGLQRRFGAQVGVRLVAGLGLSHERMRFDEAASTSIVLDDRFRSPVEAEPALAAALGPHRTDHEATRLSASVGVRSVRFQQRVGLDAVGGAQDVPLGPSLLVTVAPGLRPDNAPADLLLTASGALGASHGFWYVHATGDVRARRLESPLRTNWRDILWEGEVQAYWTPPERHSVFLRLGYAAGLTTDLPYQLTLGGTEAVRAFDVDAFPGGRRIVATVEPRLRVPQIDPGFAAVGLAFFLDGGRVWPGSVPFGGDSGWQLGVGSGLRLGFSDRGEDVVRLDVGVPLVAPQGGRRAVFRVSTELLGLLDRRSWPSQTVRSHWYGMDHDLTYRPRDPLSRN